MNVSFVSVSVAMRECWNAVFELFRTVERQLGQYSHYMLYLRIAAIELLMTEPPSDLEQPLVFTSDSMQAFSTTQAALEAEHSFPNLDISRTPSPSLSSSPLSSLTSLSSLRNFTPSPSEMDLDSADAYNESPLPVEPPEEVVLTEISHALDKFPSPVATNSLLTPLAAPDMETDTGQPSANSLCLTLFPTENVLGDDVAPLDNSQSPATNDDDLEKKKVRSRKSSRVTVSRRKRAVSMREDKENLDMDISL
ncbi:hypothetical protein DFS33DRAFT_1356273 [Desarmillaria ectypa]|nr:hypothetical protein DFS33DRAFT_1356273 [Desarmillaria ectypa]